MTPNKIPARHHPNLMIEQNHGIDANGMRELRTKERNETKSNELEQNKSNQMKRNEMKTIRKTSHKSKDGNGWTDGSNMAIGPFLIRVVILGPFVLVSQHSLLQAP